MLQPNIRIAEVCSGCLLSAGTIALIEAMRFQRVAPEIKMAKEVKVEPITEGKSSEFPCGFLSREQYEPCWIKGKIGAKKVEIGEATGQIFNQLV